MTKSSPTAKAARKPGSVAKKKTAKSPVTLVDTKPGQNEDGSWTLRLYIAGQSPKSVTAMNNLKRLCDQHLPGQYNIEVIDLVKNPQLAQMDQILAIPTLVRKLPEPIKRVIGDLSDTERTMIGLDLRKM